MARPAARRGEGRERVLDAALTLFAEHGVSGTSLQMIADKLGVTKAAVYFQFRTKEEIVLAVLQPGLARMEAFIISAEAQPTRAKKVDAALEGLVDLVVSHRRISAVLRGDPSVAHLIRDDERLRALVDRLTSLLAGPEPTVADRVAIAMAGGGLMLSGADPQLADIDDETLRRELLQCARSVFSARTRRKKS